MTTNAQAFYDAIDKATQKYKDSLADIAILLAEIERLRTENKFLREHASQRVLDALSQTTGPRRP